MTWLAVTQAFEKSWTWLKENWKVPAIIVYTIVVGILFRRNSEALKEALDAKKKSYEEQVAVLRRTHNQEILKRDGLIEEYEKIVEKLNKDFEQKNRALKEEEKEEIKEILIKSKKNPGIVKEKIRNLFGFDYVE